MIHHPFDKMTVEERASEMWRVHPDDLDRLGFLPTRSRREQFYLAHLKAAVAQALTEKGILPEQAVD